MFTASRRLFSSSSSRSATPTSGSGNYDISTSSYPPSTPEAQMRKLADYAFMLRDWRLAHSTFDIVRKDFANDKAWKYARLMKFTVGWASHLYYWIYPGVMVAVTGIFTGYVVGTLWPNFMSASLPGPLFMALVGIATSFLVAWISFRGIAGATSVNIAINVIQISALLGFSVMALGYRVNHPPGSTAWK